MKRISILCVLSLTLTLTLSPVAFAQVTKPPENPPGARSAEKPIPPVAIAGLGQEWELTLSERGRLGLTMVSAIGAAIYLAQADAINSETHRSITSALILDRIAANHGAIDELDPASLDKALEWIEGIYRFVFKALKKQGTQ